METYARINSGVVEELVQTDQQITELFHPDLKWVNVTHVEGASCGWRLEGDHLVPPPKPSLADAKADALRRVDAFAAAFRARIAGTADPIEVAGWNNKLALAMAVKAGTAKPHEVAALQVEIDLRGFGETLDQFVAKVATNAAKFSHAVGLIDGMKRRSQDAVMAAPSLEALDAVLQQMRQQAEAEYQKLIGAK